MNVLSFFIRAVHNFSQAPRALIAGEFPHFQPFSHLCLLSSMTTTTTTDLTSYRNGKAMGAFIVCANRHIAQEKDDCRLKARKGNVVERETLVDGVERSDTSKTFTHNRAIY